ncbi:hypothetical protein QR680_000172 [Steinernema hermaphroditum]|uniref:Anaphase-promoting complex subunit 4 WD40 domain-containing protein n=2 Tax=Steinernema TaxID=34507 RepID=A0AA39LDM4_9BILA|nr:hypothetical protein QR680_000172 [Steinernema hermaphroditum]
MMNGEDFFENTFAFPEELDGCLEVANGNSVCARFNRIGSLIAVGVTDGKIYIVDYITRGCVRFWVAHVQPIMNLCWSRDGHVLATTAADGTVGIWEVLTGAQLQRWRFGGTPLGAYINPRNRDQVMMVQHGHPVTICSVTTGLQERCFYEIPGIAEESTTCAVFDRRGNYIITGSSKGRIIIYDAKTTKVVAHCKQAVNHQIRQFVVSQRGDWIVTNTHDRIIRCYKLDTLLNTTGGQIVDPVAKYQDLVNKTAWRTMTISPEADYVVGANQRTHSLTIWERTSGNLIKMLHGNKGEQLQDIHWHPSRPVIVAVANGVTYIWAQAHVENWSAFAPDFKELDENSKYVEKEGEFDLEDEDEVEETNVKNTDDEDALIDVETLRPPTVLCSSDEEDTWDFTQAGKSGKLWYIPVTPEVEPDQPSNVSPVSTPVKNGRGRVCSPVPTKAAPKPKKMR